MRGRACPHRQRSRVSARRRRTRLLRRSCVASSTARDRLLRRRPRAQGPPDLRDVQNRVGSLPMVSCAHPDRCDPRGMSPEIGFGRRTAEDGELRVQDLHKHLHDRPDVEDEPAQERASAVFRRDETGRGAGAAAEADPLSPPRTRSRGSAPRRRRRQWLSPFFHRDVAKSTPSSTGRSGTLATWSTSATIMTMGAGTLRRGGSATGNGVCCGYGIAIRRAPDRCPMCSGREFVGQARPSADLEPAMVAPAADATRPVAVSEPAA